jgi:hypothetical protein
MMGIVNTHANIIIKYEKVKIFRRWLCVGKKTIRTCTCFWSLLFRKERRLAIHQGEQFSFAGEKVALQANKIWEAEVQVFRVLGFTLCPASVRMGGRRGCTA